MNSVSIHITQILLLATGTVLMVSALVLLWARTRNGLEGRLALEVSRTPSAPSPRPVPVPRIVRPRIHDGLKKTVKMERKASPPSPYRGMSSTQKMVAMGITPPE